MAASGEPQAPSTKARRVRTNATAISAAIKALQDAGLPVDKVCVTGATIEIHCAQVKGKRAGKDDGLKDW